MTAGVTEDSFDSSDMLGVPEKKEGSLFEGKLWLEPSFFYGLQPTSKKHFESIFT